MSHVHHLTWNRFVTALSGVLAGMYALVAMAGILVLSPRVPYADPWRFYARLLTVPWPRNVLAVDNGHAEILPNMLRWADLEACGGGQWLQIVVGMLFLAACAWLWILVIQKGDARETPQRPGGNFRMAWVLIGIVGLMWFGNGRTLAHANESVHAYLLMACLFGAVWLVTKNGNGRLAWALALGLVATLTFGTGVAVFAAIFLVLLLRRADWRACASCVFFTLVSVGIYFLLPRVAGTAGHVSLQPLLQAKTLLRWLAAPYLYAAGPWIDMHLVERLPSVARAVMAPSAHLSTRLFGDARTAVWPESGLGFSGLAMLVVLTWKAWRRPLPWRRQEHFALATAWFAVACGVLVSLARANYFQQFPTQIYSNRYLVWSSLFWAALLAAAALRLHAHGWRRLATGIPLLVALVLLPSTFWMLLPARHMQTVAAADALGVAVGALDRHGEHGENVLAEMVHARPILAAHGTTVFAWPESRMLGRQVGGKARMLAVSGMKIQPMDNAFGSPAAHVDFTLNTDVDASRLLLIRNDGVVTGLAVTGSTKRYWTGVADGTPAQLRSLRVAVMR